MRLVDKVAIITGAGSGIGQETAHLFAREGAAVIIADINIEAAQKVAEAIQAEGGRAAWVKCDVTGEESAAATTQAALTNFGRVDILFNNAGNEAFGTVVNTDLASWDLIFAVHVRGTYLCSKYAIPAMMEGGRGGVVINVSSVAGLIPGADGQTLYAPVKSFMVKLSESLSLENADRGVRVAALCPGFTYTEFHDVMGVDRGAISKKWWMPAEFVVDESLKALETGELFVVPGWRYKLLVAIGSRLPVKWRLAVERMSVHRRHRTRR